MLALNLKVIYFYNSIPSNGESVSGEKRMNKTFPFTLFFLLETIFDCFMYSCLKKRVLSFPGELE